MGAVTAPSPVVVAIDAGTGSARALAFTASGTCVARAAVEWEHRAVPGHPGGTDFDTRAGWEAIARAVREVVADLADHPIAAVVSSSMREGFVLFDGHDREIFACPNTDGRARAQADALFAEGLADDVYRIAGDWVSITAPARLRWLAEHDPETLARTRHIGMLSDWVNHKLCGEYVTDPTCGSSSALFDLGRRTWSLELTARVGLAAEVLPAVVEPGTTIGQVTASASADTGLPIGTPVVMGGADTQLALHAIAATPARPTIVAGTFWQTTALTTSPVIDPHRRMRTLCHVDPQSWMLEGIGFLSGLAMRWFRDAFCPDAVLEAERRGESPFTVMEEWAGAVPIGSEGVVAVLSDVMQADAWHHAAPALVGFDIADPRRHNRGTVIRAIEEAAAFVAASHLDVLDELTDGRITAAGEVVFTGGSSAGRLWPTVIAGATGLKTRTTLAPDATSYGAARLAGEAVGMSLAPLRQDETAVVAGADDRDAYRRAQGHWRRVYDAQLAATAASGLTPLFTPPGAARPTARH